MHNIHRLQPGAKHSDFAVVLEHLQDVSKVYQSEGIILSLPMFFAIYSQALKLTHPGVPSSSNQWFYIIL